MNLVIIDYGSGNLRSVENAFKTSINNNNLNFKVYVSNNLNLIKDADYIVLPGVGAYADCKKGLFKIDGLIDTLIEKVIVNCIPFLGICVGMQLMAEQGFEKEKTAGLEWIDGNIEKINYLNKDSLGRNLKIPHMGWNNLNIYNNKHPVLKNISNDEQFYFVHSYYLNTLKKDQILADTYYGHKIPAIVGQKNYLGVQFHPEKSSKSGHKLITNWLKWKP
jgi:glutamine amidotransferase